MNIGKIVNDIEIVRPEDLETQQAPAEETTTAAAPAEPAPLS